MEQQPYIPKMTHPPSPKAPHQMYDAELESSGFNPAIQQERQHREIRERVDSILSAQAELKRSVDRVHRIDVWILAAGVIAAVAGVILLFLEFTRSSGAGK